MEQLIKIVNGRVITPLRIIENGTVLVRNGIIEAITAGTPETTAAVTIDANGQYISPGFIDLHIHGGGGYDFMDATPEAFLKIAEMHAKYGTTAMVPTTLTAEKQDLLRTLDSYTAALAVNTNGATFMGIHLEGPYFAMSQRGAQHPKYIREPDEHEYREILEYSPHIVRWSIAPELKGAPQMGRLLREKGILPAIAHTDAVYEEVVTAFESGFTLATHFYSAMSGVTRRNLFRHAGVIESVYLIDEIDVEVIADGVHLPAALLKLIYKIKGPDRIALITDAMRAAGMPPGNSILGPLHGGLHVIVEDGVAKLPDYSAFAGSVATADRLVRNMVRMAEIPLHEAVRMMSLTPARIMGIQHRKGSLTPGKDADILIMDNNLSVKWTMVAGKIVHDVL
ncbi:N-acetylglucosamine-6-phosphate deacetylase [Chitinophaga pendula]|uniref:N-acetylglucosamine-6-phosphate deacetylase n=1 Tax=Chitinophaga TaxID=79328 RepID=UPI000BB0666A|nr:MULTISPECIES: N-acetylglucosamine-6-phosphate deacetylase [Chitinophaga]ASZ14075.1 N-acetylglucosamine-6-phosphate deacetylase [Chitinophaga sp. MD30]UCJ08294.1 N-acetylglucosamine-6-phosphate deacetylase [Chitinophaga pendula]